MLKRDMLLSRLQAIGKSLESIPQALGLLALGSAGVEQERLDEFSDLDFFVIVERGAKAAFLNDLSWLATIQPISFQFRNTVDGYKLLFSDDVFCEFAVFEPQELERIPYAAGNFVWRRDTLDDSYRVPKQPIASPQAHSKEWILGEALTNITVGLGRFRRGEKRSAMKFVQVYAVDRLLELIDRATPFGHESMKDAFDVDRRLEQRNPDCKEILALCCQGYNRTPESALQILHFLEQHALVNPAMKAEIERLAKG